ncbi:T9SS type A sorting domain-containing protein [Niastella sp. OAS944]|uniref:T9SS type A sorting domain-containing protein n=1 Tax=Niastella sp. OAS944 TaxID=2664089 RepID=UPI00346F4056|nr:putative repeat protein (TIGR01451 family) [Chitinophagaceae bacterium OAS944]
MIFNLRFIVAVWCTILTSTAFAQSPGIEWQRPIGGNLSDGWNSTLITTDGHLLVMSGSNRSGSLSDFRVTKMGQDGKIIWDKYAGGSGSDFLRKSINTPDGGFILTGLTLSVDGDVVGFHGPVKGANYDVWVVKFSANGAIEWTQIIGGTAVDDFVQAEVLPDGSILILGKTNSVDGDFQGNDGLYKPFVVKLANDGSVIWKTRIGTKSNDPKKMIIKSNGNIVVAGDFFDTPDSNHYLNDFFVTELSANGMVLWWNSFGSTFSPESLFDVIQTGSSQVSVVVTSSGSDRNMTGALGGGDVWMFTLDNNGSIVWKRPIGGSRYDGSPKMYFNNIDSSILVTMITSSIDGDVGKNNGDYDVWTGKFSNNGTLLWKIALGGSGAESFNQTFINAAGETFLLGTTTSNNGDINGFHGVSDLLFVKLAANGTLAWQKCLGGSLNESISMSNLPRSDNFFDDGNTFTILASTGSNDGDVQGMHFKSDTSTNDMWLVNVNANGGINWQRPLGGFGLEIPGKAYKINGKYFVFGNTNSNDGDVSGLKGSQNTWVVKLGPANIIKGNVFLDLNANGIKDAGEYYYSDVIVNSEKPGYKRSGIPYNGQFKIEVDTGSFITSIAINKPYYTAVTVPHQSNFANYLMVDSVDFALQPIAVTRDVQVSIINTSAARPGFNSSYSIHYKNDGTETITTGTVIMVKDSGTTFVSAVPVPDLQNGDTLVWNYNNLLPEQSASIAIVLKNKIAPDVNIGDTLMHIVFIKPATGDIQPVNNRDTLLQIVTGSFDPNDKSENHAGRISPAAVSNGEELSYVINFQNLGTDTAFNVVIMDTLSDKLDWSSIEMIGASHPWTLQITDNNKFKWTFGNILLPHAAINEPASHGYIAYRIKPKTNLSIGEVITNSASIYFDFNAPIVTNLVSTIVKPDPVVQPVISGLVNNYCGTVGVQKIKLLNLPNNTAAVTVKLDNTILTIAVDSTVSIAPGTLTGGTHTVSVSYSNTTDTKTTTASFTVTVAATPDVNLSASTTNVVTLANPVVLTATNVSGGGKNPLYTFAWNNSFTNIVQAESSNNSISIPAASLALGDNKVYVKMRTSENCYTAQENIDSITIRRDMSTGITDTDNPGQVITVYPNPVKGPITIKGLSTGKTYTFTIVNLQGQVVLTKRIANQSTAAITGFNSAAGTYWLKIYDEKISRILGTLQLIKQ